MSELIMTERTMRPNLPDLGEMSFYVRDKKLYALDDAGKEWLVGVWGNNAKSLLANIDLHAWSDAAISGELYEAVDPVNAPAPGYWYIQVLRHSNDSGSAAYRTLKAEVLASSEYPTGTKFYQACVNGVWGDWIREPVNSYGVLEPTAGLDIVEDAWMLMDIWQPKSLVGVYRPALPSTSKGFIIPYTGVYQFHLQVEVGKANKEQIYRLGIGRVHVEEYTAVELQEGDKLLSFHSAPKLYTKGNTVSAFLRVQNEVAPLAVSPLTDFIGQEV